jgi:hypothetical protein
MMQLNLPILHLLENRQNILIAGAGGGFDVFCGLPLYFTLRAAGKNVHLANYSFSPVALVQQINPVIPLEPPFLLGALPQIRVPLPYYPEGFLARWFKEARGEDVPIWMFAKVGPKLLHTLYERLIAHLQIDALILVDGGIDSLMIGDESGAGTLLEDTISLTATENLDIPTKILACIGFGAEIEVCHRNALDNMAALVKVGAFYGSCALTHQMPAYEFYASASRYVWEQPSHHKSQINMRIVSATQGEFGNHHLYHDYPPAAVFVSPLTSLYWFFDAQAVVKRSLLAPAIRHTLTIDEAYEATLALRTKLMPVARPCEQLPL